MDYLEYYLVEKKCNKNNLKINEALPKKRCRHGYILHSKECDFCIKKNKVDYSKNGGRSLSS